MTGLSHVQLLVSDVGASAAWYSAALGLEPYAEDLDIGYVALRHRAAKAVFVLARGSGDGEHRGTNGATGSEMGSGSGGVLDHLAFAVPDGTTLQAWADHLTEAGIAHPGVVLENGNPTLQLRDPDGIAIELVAPAPVPT
jgi:catechol 2,3-dioxygenase-like lactoylglutathione lyase family enzyme